MNNTQTKLTRKLIGKVISNKMDKGIVVKVERQVKHPLYGKYLRRSIKIHADDPQKICKEGDTVSVEQCRPLSKTKNWKLVEVLEKGNYSASPSSG